MIKIEVALCQELHFVKVNNAEIQTDIRLQYFKEKVYCLQGTIQGV